MALTCAALQTVPRTKNRSGGLHTALPHTALAWTSPATPLAQPVRHTAELLLSSCPWKEFEDKNQNGKKYYHNQTTNETVWEKPAELANLEAQITGVPSATAAVPAAAATTATAVPAAVASAAATAAVTAAATAQPADPKSAKAAAGVCLVDVLSPSI